jgi:hypothetical protein
MFGSQALETAIGIAFFFLAISVFVTSVQEFLATTLALRAKMLAGGLKRLLAQGEGDAAALAILAHPGVCPDRDKSYIAAQDFTAAVTDVLSGGDPAAPLSAIQAAIVALPDSAFKRAAQAAATRAGGDVGAFERQLSTWFDNCMERLSAQYKRFSGYLSLALGAALAFLFNLDALRVAKSLWLSDTLREQAVAVAAAAKDMPAANIGLADQTLVLFGFHVNWFDPGWGFSGLTAFGCAITAFAVSLGAPFWFDMLQNVLKINLRGTGAKPARADG